MELCIWNPVEWESQILEIEDIHSCGFREITVGVWCVHECALGERTHSCTFGKKMELKGFKYRNVKYNYKNYFTPKGE